MTNDSGTDSGSAYLFDVSTGQQLSKLTPSDAVRGDEFSTSVAISGNTAIVGARYVDDADRGSAYLFVLEPTTLTRAALGLIGCAVRWRRG